MIVELQQVNPEAIDFLVCVTWSSSATGLGRLRLNQRAHDQDPETAAAKWNSAIIMVFVHYNYLLLSMTSKLILKKQSAHSST